LLSFENAALKEIYQRLFFDLDSWRQPESSPSVAVDSVGGLLIEGTASKGFDKSWKVGEVLVGIRIHPPHHWVIDKGQHQGSGEVFLISSGGKANGSIRGEG